MDILAKSLYLSRFLPQFMRRVKIHFMANDLNEMTKNSGFFHWPFALPSHCFLFKIYPGIPTTVQETVGRDNTKMLNLHL